VAAAGLVALFGLVPNMRVKQLSAMAALRGTVCRFGGLALSTVLWGGHDPVK